MKKYSLQVNNLRCDNCIKQLKVQLEKINIHVKNIMPGKIILANKPGNFQLMRIRVILRSNKMQLIVGRKQMIAEKIKGFIKNSIHSKDKINRNYSDLISDNIGLNYSYLSRLFRSVEKITIEKYITSQRLLRVKQLLINEELTEKQIAEQCGYSSVHYLSNQFKKVEGITPSTFKKKQKTSFLQSSSQKL